jgi:hypothetical protein
MPTVKAFQAELGDIGSSSSVSSDSSDAEFAVFSTSNLIDLDSDLTLDIVVEILRGFLLTTTVGL